VLIIDTIWTVDVYVNEKTETYFAYFVLHVIIHEVHDNTIYQTDMLYVPVILFALVDDCVNITQNVKIMLSYFHERNYTSGC